MLSIYKIQYVYKNSIICVFFKNYDLKPSVF